MENRNKYKEFLGCIFCHFTLDQHPYKKNCFGIYNKFF